MSIQQETSPVRAEERSIFLPRPYTQPDAFRNLTFDEKWLTLDGLPFGLEAWALQYMQPGDYATGMRVIDNIPPHEPQQNTFRVKREYDGSVDIQYQISKHESFSLRANSAVMIRQGSGTQAKWMPFFDLHGYRVWKKLWERKIVRENVCPLIPATNGAALEHLRDSVYRLALHYGIPTGEVADPGNLFFFNWEADVLPSNKKEREAMYKDIRSTDNHLMRMVLNFYDMELRLKDNAKDLTPVQKLAEFQHFVHDCKRALGRQDAENLRARSSTK